MCVNHFIKQQCLKSVPIHQLKQWEPLVKNCYCNRNWQLSLYYISYFLISKKRINHSGIGNWIQLIFYQCKCSCRFWNIHRCSLCTHWQSCTWNIQYHMLKHKWCNVNISTYVCKYQHGLRNIRYCWSVIFEKSFHKMLVVGYSIKNRNLWYMRK